MLKILRYPDPRLKIISEPVKVFDQNLHQLLDDMAEVMQRSGGIGLAAPQVGKALRVFVIDLSLENEDKKKLYEFINPQISQRKGQAQFEEGCLSLPGITCTIKRSETIDLKYLDRYGKPHVRQAHELLAVAIQHENDHLDGILLVDRLPLYKRFFCKRKLSKQLTPL